MFTASDVLLKAASRIEEEGMWCQGDFFAVQACPVSTDRAFELRLRMEQRVPECALGALISAAVELGEPFQVVEDAQHLLANELHVLFASGVGEWNDTFDRTAQEVAEAMRRAAS